ncbi:MAG TPA: DNA polymerase III subunit delta [Candidatus Anoxymicrobiaceae bacterium]
MAKKRVEKIEDLNNVYYVYGDEELLIQQALDRLKALFGAEADADFNLEVIDAAAMGADHVVDAAETIPLMSPRRLVIARGAETLSKKEQEVINSYLDRANPATVLVLAACGSGPGERDSGVIKKVESSPLYKKVVAAGGEPLKFSFGARGRQKKVSDWVTEEFDRRGKTIQPAARDMLLEMVGRELRDLEDAVERVCLYAADSASVGCDEITQVVVPSAEQGIFELVDSVADRRRDLSLYLLNKLIRQGESPQRIFSLLLRQFRLIARTKSLARDHEYGDIASTLGIPPFLVGKCLKQSARFSAERLRSAFGEFRRAQVEMHSNRYLGEKEYQGAILEMLIVKIIG